MQRFLFWLQKTFHWLTYISKWSCLWGLLHAYRCCTILGCIHHVSLTDKQHSRRPATATATEDQWNYVDEMIKKNHISQQAIANKTAISHMQLQVTTAYLAYWKYSALNFPNAHEETETEVDEYLPTVSPGPNTGCIIFRLKTRDIQWNTITKVCWHQRS